MSWLEIHCTELLQDLKWKLTLFPTGVVVEMCPLIKVQILFKLNTFDLSLVYPAVKTNAPKFKNLSSGTNITKLNSQQNCPEVILKSDPSHFFINFFFTTLYCWVFSCIIGCYLLDLCIMQSIVKNIRALFVTLGEGAEQER